MTVLIRSCWAR